MSAQRLREAAKVLRDRAEAATPGPWRTNNSGLTHPVGTEIVSEDGVVTSECCGYQGSVDLADAALITLLRLVPEPLADWLDDLTDHDASDLMPMERGAYVIADLILGDDQ